jgi:hypothetical protein
MTHRPDKQLALRPRGGLKRQKIVFSRDEHQPQYAIESTALGDAVLAWREAYLAGLFCVQAFPPEIVAYVQQLLGPYRTGHWPEFEAQPCDIGPFTPLEGAPKLISINGRLLPGPDAPPSP